ncbi:MAG: RagB/SusD family nutrient uptake outer membrane protein [Bacteroidales bacterium]|nr:RagB/SusD family nutrient uptake outer membrane protein [Bacteroidales bacterium]
MKTLRITSYYKKIMKWLLMSLVIFILSGLYSCNDEELLNQVSKSELTDASVLNSKAGFEMYLSGLIYQFRDEWQIDDRTYWTQFTCTDMYNFVDPEEKPQRDDWRLDYTPESDFAEKYWEWAYVKMIPMANNIIKFAQKPENSGIWENEAEKNAIIAEGKFFRAWTYNILANLFGDAIIIEEPLPAPKFDFQRAPRSEVYELAKADLEFASQWLPETVDESKEGRAVKAAAQHLLTEVCISLGEYDAAIASASNLINSGLYHLMTERFGNFSRQPGDPFSDLFKDGNFNRSSGNMESILVWQIEEFIEGGIGSYGRGNNLVRGFAPFLVNFRGPDGKYGWIYDPSIPGTDTMGRGAGFVRPSNYALYDIWQNDWADMRNSRYNMRREFYFNNPESQYYGLEWDNSYAQSEKDTSRRVYAYSLKVEGPLFQGGDGDYKGRTRKDVYVIRLAETYLLRAEAYLKKGVKDSAAADINVVRARANAPAVTAGEVTIEYILDERARELMTEEPRTRTLIRMGKLVERVRLYDPDPVSRETVEDHNQFWPVPQSAIDANTGAVLEQNDGYL